MRRAQASTVRTGESTAEETSARTPGRASTLRMAASVNVIGASEPSMNIPCPPGPNATVTWGKTARNVRICAFVSATLPPNGNHCIITPPGVNRACPAW